MQEGDAATPFPINGLTAFFPEMTQSLGVMQTQRLCFFLVLGARTFHSKQFMNFKNHEPCLPFWKHTDVLLYGSCSEGECSSHLHANSKKPCQAAFIFSWPEALGPGLSVVSGHMVG